MAVYQPLVSTYARNIYLYGTRSFSIISQEYVQPVKEYAAKNFTRVQIDNALAKTWITQQEYDDTVALIPVA
jgi:hypothetical protein